MIAYLEKEELPEEKAAKKLILESKLRVEGVLHHEHPTDLQSGAVVPKKNSQNFYKNIMEADLLDTLLSGKCSTLRQQYWWKGIRLMFVIIVVPA